MNAVIKTSQDDLAAFCERWGVVELALFGSALRDELGPDSDVDILVSFNDKAPPTLLDMVRMEDELTELFGRPADLMERDAIEASGNYISQQGHPWIGGDDLCGEVKPTCWTC